MLTSNPSIGRLKSLVASIGIAAFGAMIFPTGSFAQDDEDDQTQLEEIIVTGSHVRRSEFEGASPLQIMDAGTISALGATQTMDILKNLTINSGSEIISELAQTAGTSQFNVRGLGFSSTLTLVNGRRVGISPGDDGSGGSYVDINQFPLAMIKRIEVLSDGASATYGSDAVGGVVNIITRKGFEGFELSLESRDANSISSDSYSVSLATGLRTDNGMFNVYATAFTQDGNTRTDFDWLVKRIAGDGIPQNSRLLSGRGGPGSYRLSSGGPTVADADCEAALGVIRDSRPGNCRFNFADQIGVVANESRAQMFAEYEYQLFENTTYFGEARYSHNVIDKFQGTPGWAGGNFTIPADHPFNFYIQDPDNPRRILYVNPGDWDPDTMTAVELTAISRPLTAEYNAGGAKAGEFTNRNVFDYFGATNGLEFDLPNDWQASVVQTTNYASLTRTARRQFNEDILLAAIASGEFNLFGTSVTNPGLISPKDGVSTAGNDDVLLQRIISTELSNRYTNQHVIEAILSGPIFDLKTGTINGAIGAQYRYLKEVVTPDSLTAATEDGSRSLISPIKGTERVTALFGEVIVPVNDIVELQLALRYEDYADVGSTVDPKVAALIRPTDWLNIRASWGTSFQAPTLRQTSDNRAGATLNDEVQLIEGVLTCTGVPQNFFASVVNRGGENLEPQESKNFNIGFTLRPVKNLSVSLDYWSFDYTNLIAQSASAQAIVDNDCNDGIVNDPRIIRDGAGQLREVISDFINVGSVKTSGLDAVVVYNYELPNSRLLSFDLRATWVESFDIDTNGDGKTIDGVGSRNFTNSFHSMPELRANLGVTYSTDNHILNLWTRYIDDYKNDQSNNATIKSMTTVDVRYSFVANGWLGDGQSTISIGVNNVLDADPPALRRNNKSGQLITQADDPINYIDRPSYDQLAGHDIRGRIVYLQLKHAF